MNLGVDAINLVADRRGMGRVVRQTLNELENLGVRPTLITRDTTGSVKRSRFDAVWYPWNGMRFAPHARSIVTIHDLFAFTFPHRSLIARRREQAPIRRALREADVIFAVSQWTADQIAALFPRAAARVRVVRNGVSRFFHPVEPSSRGYFFSLGGSETRKNSRMLLSAYARAFRGGDPPLVVGASSDEELRDRYSGALAVLVPSLAEGYGLPAAEAMACGAPVIAANSAALPETCGDAAMLVDPRDERAWAAAMQRIADNPLLRDDLRARGLQRASQFDPAEPARALLQAVREADVAHDRA